MRALAIAMLSALLCAPQATAAGPASSFVRFFRWSPQVPVELRRALELYEHGDALGTAAAAARGIAAQDEQNKKDENDRTFLDELLLLQSLAFAELGWRGDAEQSFTVLLEAAEPGPYYPLALLELVEIRHGDGRFDAVVEAYRRYWEAPSQGKTRRDVRRRNFLRSYGDVRTGGPLFTRDEQDLLASPSRLAGQLQRRKDRPSDRVLYLAGLDLFRAREYARSLEALSQIAITSFYFPYAQYTAAQDLWALGDVDEAESRLERFRVYPLLDGEERALGERAGMLLVQVLFEAGRTDDALDAARRIGAGGRYAGIAALLRAEIVLAADKPSFALAFYEDVKGIPLGFRLDAERALGVGEAYTRLGDYASAATNLRAASETLSAEIRRLRTAAADAEVERLRALVAADVMDARSAEAVRRRRIAEGIRRVVAMKGPMNLGKLSRIAMAPHRHTILGQPVYDLTQLAESDRAKRARPTAREGPWLRYVESGRRGEIEAAQASLLDLESKTAEPGCVLDAALGIAEGRFGGPSRPAEQSSADVNRVLTTLGLEARLATDATPGDIARLRRRVLVEPDTAPAPVATAEIDAARKTAESALDEALSFELRKIVAEEADDLRRIEFDLQTVLSETIVRQNAAQRAVSP